MYSVHYLLTGASSPEVPNFINKMRLSVLLEILERANNLHSSPAPAPAEVPPQQLLLCAQHMDQDLNSLQEAELGVQLSLIPLLAWER